MKKIVIVGWGVMEGDYTCMICGSGDASVYIDSEKAGINDPDYYPFAPACKECCKGGEDKIAEVFKKINL